MTRHGHDSTDLIPQQVDYHPGKHSTRADLQRTYPDTPMSFQRRRIKAGVRLIRVCHVYTKLDLAYMLITDIWPSGSPLCLWMVFTKSTYSRRNVDFGLVVSCYFFTQRSSQPPTSWFRGPYITHCCDLRICSVFAGMFGRKLMILTDRPFGPQLNNNPSMFAS
jgi:hypothetical protein